MISRCKGGMLTVKALVLGDTSLLLLCPTLQMIICNVFLYKTLSLKESLHI